jgi:hypothetical protein
VATTRAYFRSIRMALSPYELIANGDPMLS